MRSYVCIALGLMILASSAVSAPQIVLRPYTDVTCSGDSVVTGSHPIEKVAVLNPEATQTDIVFTLGYYTPDGAPLQSPSILIYGSLQPTPTYQTVLDGGRYYISVHLFNVPPNSSAVDYIGIQFPVFYDGSSNGKHLCFDSSTYSGFAPWSATPGPGIEFDAARCYKIVAIPNCCSQIDNAPSNISGSICADLVYDFDAQSLDGGPLQFKVISGPGQIDLWTGQWTFTPPTTESGLSLSLVVAACSDICGDGSYSGCASTTPIPVTVSAGHAPSFSGPDPARFFALTGVPLSIELPVSDQDTCTGNHRFSWFTNIGDPVPPAVLDSLSGEFVYTGASADTNLYRVYLVVRELPTADTAEVDIYHFESSTCGDLDHGGAVDVGDLTWLVDYLFFSGSEPVPFLSGDVTCDGVVDIGDLSALVEFLFYSGAAPCSGCK